MPFGRRVGTVGELRREVNSGANLIRYIRKDEAIMVRFLQEPEEWYGYREVWDDDLRKSYPAPDDDTLPGAPTGEPGQRISKRYLANALDVNSDRVIALQLPADLTKQLVSRYERYDTIMDRDYELSRTGEALNTTYMQSPEPPQARKLTKYQNQLLDLEDVLRRAYEDAFPPMNRTRPKVNPQASRGAGRPGTRISRATNSDGDEYDTESDTETDETEMEESPVRTKKAAKATKTAKRPALDGRSRLVRMAKLADEEDDADAQEELSTAADEAGVDVNDYDTWMEVVEAIRDANGQPPTKATATKKASRPSSRVVDPDEEEEPEDDEEPDDDEEDAEVSIQSDEEDEDEPEDEDEGEVFSESELQSMSIGRIRGIAREYEVPTRGLSKGDLVEAILEAQEG